MKCTIARKPFLESYTRAAAFSAARSPKPILQSVLLTVGDEPTVEATDLDVGMRCPVEGVRATQPGQVLLGDRFGAILRSSTDEELTLETEDNLRVTGLHSDFTLMTDDPTLFPLVPQRPDDNASYKVSAQEFKALVRRTVFCTDVESTKYALGGCLVEIERSLFSLVASDGRRLAKATCAFERDGEPTELKNSVISLKALKLVDRLLDGMGPLQLSGDGRAVWFDTEHGLVWSQLIEGRFPRYQDVFPEDKGEIATVDAELLCQALQQASVVCSEDSRGVDFRFTAGSVTMQAGSGTGKSKVQLGLNYNGGDHEVTLDPRYLLDAVKVLLGLVELEVTGPNAPVLLRADGYQYVVMPLTKGDA